MTATSSSSASASEVPTLSAALDLTDKTVAELAVWVPEMITGYAEQRIAAGEERELAYTVSKEQFSTLLPDSRPAEGQHVMNVVLDGATIGDLWMGGPLQGTNPDTWFVFWVTIDEAHRGRGLGRAAMLAAEAWTLAHGGRKIGLNVFGPNTVARSLYDSLGYVVQATSMAKDLTQSA